MVIKLACTVFNVNSCSLIFCGFCSSARVSDVFKQFSWITVQFVEFFLIKRSFAALRLNDFLIKSLFSLVSSKVPGC